MPDAYLQHDCWLTALQCTKATSKNCSLRAAPGAAPTMDGVPSPYNATDDAIDRHWRSLQRSVSGSPVMAGQRVEADLLASHASKHSRPLQIASKGGLPLQDTSTDGFGAVLSAAQVGLGCALSAPLTQRCF